MPVYNVEKYLPQCLDSIMNQTYTEFEVIIVDDGSTDSSGKICDEYANRDSRIKVFHQENKGAAIAKNTALEHIQGDFFTFVDSDDYIEKDMLENMIFTQKKTGADIVECGFWNEYVGEKEEHTIVNDAMKIMSTEEYMEWYINHWTSSLLWNKLFRFSLLKNIRFRYERRCIDDEFFTYKVVLNAQKICLISEKFYHYRKRRSSAILSPQNERQKTCDTLEMMQERFETVNKWNADLGKVYLYHMNDFLLCMLNVFYIDEEIVKEIQSILQKYYIKSKQYKLKRRFLWHIKKIIKMSPKELMQNNQFRNEQIEAEKLYE